MSQVRIVAALVLAIVPCRAHAQAAVKASCSVRSLPTTPAEAAMAREDYPAALDLYHKMGQTDPVAGRAGVIRVLLAMDQVTDAEAIANGWVANEPKSADALLSQAAVQFRKGLLNDAYKTAAAARAANLCLARADLLVAQFETLAGYHAMSKSHIDLAHRLDPYDPEIRRAWIATLSRKRRVEELAAVLNETDLTSAKDKTALPQEIDYLKQTKADDCSIVKPVASAKIPIRAILNGPTRIDGLALDVSLNGKARRLELDTGASGILLSRSAAASLGLIHEQQFESYGIGDKGKVASSVAHVDSIRIGDVEFRHCPITILEKKTALDIDGLIGGNVFSKFLLTIDYPKSQVRLDPLPRRPEDADAKPPANTLKPAPASGPTTAAEEDETKEPVFHDRYIAPEMKDWTRIYRSGHDLVLPVDIGGSTGKLFIVDTGASTMLISPAAAREVTKVHGDSDMHIYGISGEVNKVYETGSFPLTFAHLRQKVDSMTAIDTTKFSHDAGFEISGFLGAPILQRLTIHIDYRDNLIKFDYDPQNDYRFRTY